MGVRTNFEIWLQNGHIIEFFNFSTKDTSSFFLNLSDSTEKYEP